MNSFLNFNILVVDDEKTLTRALSMALTDAGYFVDTAHTMKEGLEKLKSKTWDVLITDISLAGRDEGLEILARINRSSLRPYVIVTTAQSDFEVAKKALNDHAYALINKPYDIADIIRTIEEVGRLREENQELIEKAKERDELTGLFETRRQKTKEDSRDTPFGILTDQSGSKTHCDYMTGCMKDLFYFIAVEQQSARLKTRLELWFMKRMLTSPLARYEHADDIIGAINKIAVEQETEPSRVFVFVWNAKNGSLEYASAGWEEAYFWEGHSLKKLELTGGLAGLSPRLTFTRASVPFSKICSILLISHAGRDIVEHERKTLTEILKGNQNEKKIFEQCKNSLSERGLLWLRVPGKEASWTDGYEFADVGSEIRHLRERVEEFSCRELKVLSPADRFAVYALILELYIYILDNSAASGQKAFLTVQKQPERFRFQWACGRRNVLFEKTSVAPVERLLAGLATTYEVTRNRAGIETFEAVWRIKEHARS